MRTACGVGLFDQESQETNMDSPSISSTQNENKNNDTSNTDDTNVSPSLPGYNTIDDFTKVGFQAVLSATKFSNNLPSGHNWDLYSGFPSFQRVMDYEGNRILEIMNMVIQHQGLRGNIVMRDKEEKFDLLVDANDAVLERVGCNLDELSGIRRNPVPVVVESSGTTTRVVSGSWNRGITGTKPMKSPGCEKYPVRLLTAKNVERPQIKFRDKIDNSSTPFEPRIKEKPNSLKPLAILVEGNESGECFSHPYEYELDMFKAPGHQLQKVTPRKYLPVEETPLVFVNEEDDVAALLSDLKKHTEIAVDLEHHSYRTFQGFTCLMQISTRDKDYIVDTLALRDKLEVLNEVFTDPKVVKVFHGASSDIEWLQRDLNVYVVNMFDTHLAARILNFAHLSLAFLLKHYCEVTANKQFQLADWRIRPLPEELIKYAREDTHYLLYIYDIMKNSLLEAANGQTPQLLSVLEQSKEVCKKRYEKPLFREDSHLELYRRNKKMFDNKQMYAFKELYRWRDKIAREEDESTGYVLPNHMLLNIAEVLPREMQGILALCSPIPPLVRQNLMTLHHIVLKAREQSLIRPVLEEEARLRPFAQVVWHKIDLDSPLYCPHDMKHVQDFREDLPTLLNSSSSSLEKGCLETLWAGTPQITVFESDSECEEQQDREVIVNGRALFVSPYQRYKCARPFIEAQEHVENEASNDNSVETTQQSSAPETVGTQPPVEENILSLKYQVTKKRKREDEDSLPKESSSHLKHKRKKNREATNLSPRPDNSKTEVAGGSNSSENIQEKKTPDNTKTVEISVKKKKPKQIQPYDYSKVDFSQFQGGSGNSSGTKKNKQHQEKFKPKGRKSKFIGKTNHKSLTFGSKRR